MNEQYGNWAGGVTHPYTWHQFWQRLVNIIFSMGGYDEFLAGAFWFFRGLLVASIAFLVLYLLLYNRHKWLNHDTVPIVIAVLSFGFSWFKVAEHLSIVTLVQGGIRDCWGVMFFSLGVLYRRHESRIREHWVLTLLYAAILVFGAYQGWQGMALVMNVVLNRRAAWGMSISDVIYAKGQFSVIGCDKWNSGYLATEAPIALQAVKDGWDGSQGALFFCAPSGRSVWMVTTRQYLFTAYGHEFYR
jgi:hypothetical protein